MNITLATSVVEFRAGLPRGEWPGRDRVYVTLTLGFVGMVPTLTAEVMGGGSRWTYRGWRAFVLFERLANRLIESKGLEAQGMRKAA